MRIGTCQDQTTECCRGCQYSCGLPATRHAGLIALLYPFPADCNQKAASVAGYQASISAHSCLELLGIGKEENMRLKCSKCRAILLLSHASCRLDLHDLVQAQKRGGRLKFTEWRLLHGEHLTHQLALKDLRLKRSLQLPSCPGIFTVYMHEQ